MAGGGGLEPPLPGPEPGVLPLDDPPGSPQRRTIRPRAPTSVNARACNGSAHGALERATGAELRYAGARNRDHAAIARMPTATGGAPRDDERAEAGDRDRPALPERLAHAGDERGERAVGRGPRAARALGENRYEIGLGHARSAGLNVPVISRHTAFSNALGENGFSTTGTSAVSMKA